MKFAPSTDFVTVDDKEELAIMISAEVTRTDSIQAFVGGLIENFINHKIISPPEVSILGIRIQGYLNVEAFISEWKLQLMQNEVAMVFYEKLTVIDATYESIDGNVIDLDIII